jgi:hypothetical protein
MGYDELYKSLVPTEESILEQVDEFTLYCFYTKQEDLRLNKAYSSPYRKDEFPSFSIFKTKYNIGVEYYWKDSATGETGNIFKLIKNIEDLSNKEEVFQKINEDFGLDYNLPALEQRAKIKLYNPPKESLIKIRISEIPLTEAGIAFWKQFDISKELLDFYKTTQINYYWSYKEQIEPYVVPDPTFAYRIGEYYQIYSPFAQKTYKFRNDFPEDYFFGYTQLSRGIEKTSLIIDKSCKDVIFCRRLGYEAVCGKSETTMIPEKKMLEFKERYTTVYLMLDNDLAGKTQVEKYVQKYPWLQVRFIPESISKDKTDCCKKIGLEETRKLLTQLIQ